MWLTHKRTRLVELDDTVFRRLLNFYPEENLLSRRLLSEALTRGTIAKLDLQREANTLFIPWHMFLLTPENLRAQLVNIERTRKDRIKIARLSSRGGQDGPPPNRLIDRYIRAQAFLHSTGLCQVNRYNNSLRGKTPLNAVERLSSYFQIDRSEFWQKPTKEAAFEYLMTRIEARQINVALGTSEARLVPTSRNHKVLYRNISGFCLKDDRVPFVFINTNLSDEEEPLGRRIFTLVYLVALVGLGVYTVTRDWRMPLDSSLRDPYSEVAYRITSSFLLPEAAIAPYRGRDITRAIVNDLSGRYKLTPAAVLVRLLREQYISRDQYEALTVPTSPHISRLRSPRIDRAVRRLNGRVVCDAVTKAFRSNGITQNQAQYILFGRIRREAWRAYRAQVHL